MNNLSGQDFVRIANNFYNLKEKVVDLGQIGLDAELINYINSQKDLSKYKVAFCYICINPTYWEYAKPMIEGAKQYFLPGHNVDFLFWTDMPKPDDAEKLQAAFNFLVEMARQRHAKFGKTDEQEIIKEANDTMNKAYDSIKAAYANKVFPIEPIEWPMPTLMRFHTFLQQEELLKEYDYIFYCDIDMKFVGIVGDEILGEGLTCVQHPMYALDKSMWPPYEPNFESVSYIPRPGMVINDPNSNSGKRFLPLYAAGGFQGGKSVDFINAMKVMKAMIDADLINGYIPIWNDETVWNKYLFEHKPAIILTPSYVYPDSLIKEYYEPRWGTSYPPKLITITKKHTLVPVNFNEINKFK